MKFIYSSGQKPLKGFTIKRGIGRGAFGEVYYAVSDAGKEVALKLLLNQKELRGIKPCLNFKHPNLVVLYDVLTDDQGDAWIVMEYVAGESLSAIMQRSPRGLDPELARQWFLEIAAAVRYLHDNGPAHRDLKPGNIFIENNHPKVGDYSLCKLLNDGEHHAETAEVGTVYYMAPEISTGNYGNQVDIYACGVILYEMLTGVPPFVGESPREILHRHLTDLPDMERVPAEYIPILSKALAKNPLQRFRTMTEMARAVEAVGKPPRETEKASEPQPEKNGVAPVHPVVKQPEDTPAPGWQRAAAELCGSLALAAVLAALLVVVIAGVFQKTEPEDLGRYFFLTVSACWAVLIPAKFLTGPVQDSWKLRTLFLALGLALGVQTLWLEGQELPGGFTGSATVAATETEDAARAPRWLPAWLAPGRNFSPSARYLSYFALVFVLMRWWKLAERQRPEWFSLKGVAGAALLGTLLLVLWPRPAEPYCVIGLALAAGIVQVVSPWDRPAPPRGPRVSLYAQRGATPEKLRLPHG